MSGRRKRSESLWDSKESQSETKEFNSNNDSPKRSNLETNDVLMSDDFSAQGNENMLMDNDNISDKHRMMTDRAFDDWEGQYGQPNRGGSRAVGGRDRVRSRSPHRTRNQDQDWDQDRAQDRGRTRGLARSRSRSRSRSRGREQGRATSPSRGGSNRVNNRPDYSGREQGGSQYNRTNKSAYNDQDNRRQSTQDIKRPCKFFLMGRCNRDDNCRFSHDVSKSDIYHNDDQESRFIPDNNSGKVNVNGNGTNRLLNGSVSEDGKPLEASRNDIPQASSLPQVSQSLDFAALGVLYSTVVNEPVKASAPMKSQKSKEPEPKPVGKVEANEKKVAEKSKLNVGKSEVDEGNMGNDEKAMRAFKGSLVEFVKEILKPTWKEGKMSRDAYKTIVKKVVEKVTGTIEGVNIPRTQEKTDQYLAFSKSKIAKLVEAYVGRLAKG